MPFYEYKCSNCGFELEELQKMSDEPLKKCPECGKNTLQKLLGTGGGLIFKGSGFYLTDYKKKSSSSQDSSKSSRSTGSKKEANKSNDKSTDKSADKSPGKTVSSTESKKTENTKKEK
jgi:putative FmdB family regulatory protein